MPLFFFFTHFEERSPMGCESFCKKEEGEHLEHVFWISSQEKLYLKTT